ncbi:hypothetical protein BDF19DRAFT_436473 [Syncephalis fuscata]|nr:hypothetical protein BDF19DRAFT_436473 [Syncephalis fuscata]
MTMLSSLIPLVSIFISILLLCIRWFYCHGDTKKGLYRRLSTESLESIEHLRAVPAALDDELDVTEEVENNYNNYSDNHDDDAATRRTRHSSLYSSKATSMIEHALEINIIIESRNRNAAIWKLAGCLLTVSSSFLLIWKSIKYEGIQDLWLSLTDTIVWIYLAILSTIVLWQTLDRETSFIRVHQHVLLDTWHFTNRKHLPMLFMLLGAQIAVIGILLIRNPARITRTADMWELTPEDRSATAFDQYYNVYRRSLLQNLLMTFRKEITLQCFYVLFWSSFVFITPLSLQLFLHHIQAPLESFSYFYASLCVAGLFLGESIASNIQQQNTMIGLHLSLRSKAILAHKIYQKGLSRQINISYTPPTIASTASTHSSYTQYTEQTMKSSSENAMEWATGAIVNLLNVDVQNIGEALSYLHVLIGSVLQVCITVVFLWALIGPATLVGFVIFGLLLVLSNMVMARLTGLYEVLYSATDRRLSVISEMLQSMRIIKYLAWENKFCKRVFKARSKELQLLWRRHILFVYIATSVYGGPMLVTCVSLGTYAVGFNHVLTPSLAFTTMMLFSSLRSAMSQLPDMLFWVLQCRVSGKRIEEFLAEPDVPASSDSFGYSGHQRKTDRIGIVNGEFCWSSISPDSLFMDINSTSSLSGFKLQNINVEFQVGQLNVIAGPTGSGKTSLLLALLGEMPCVHGQVFLPRKKRVLDETGTLSSCIAYVAQQAWLQNISIRDNILFGQSYDAQRYLQVSNACALEKDFENLDMGDATQIGEIGVTLSNGLRQRIAIARAVYSRANHIIMDDCFSAVDMPTAKHIMDKCILGPLMRDRTCILVTHHVDMGMHNAALAILMQDGCIVSQGQASEVLVKALLLYDDASVPVGRTSSFVNSVRQRPTVTTPTTMSTAAIPTTATTTISTPTNLSTNLDNTTHLLVDYQHDNGPIITAATNTTSTNVYNNQPIGGRLIDDEVYAEGSVPFKIYRAYFNASGGYLLWTAIFSIYIEQTTAQNRRWHFVIYFALTLITLAFIGLPHFFTYFAALKASHSLHGNLVNSITRATIRFFDTTPVGRIINRFSSDINAIDQDLPTHLFFLISAVGNIIFQLAIIAVVLPHFIPISISIGIIYVLATQYYLKASRSIKRIESVSRSPFLSKITETLRGVVTIRAFGTQQWFMSQISECIDTMNRPVYLLTMSTQWMLNLIGWIAAFVVLLVGVFIIIYHNSIDASTAGFILTYALMFSESASYAVQNYSKIEITMNAVERVIEYSQVEQELPEIIESYRPPDEWPMHGNLSVEHLFVRYALHLSPVIRDVTFNIYPGERVGVVGRTGAGKSTLSAALFRFVEPMAGKIIIDNIDISQIGLHDLRSRLTIIPQDMVLFSGTIRTNLDPFSQHDDHIIWNALRRCHLVSRNDEATRPINLGHLDAPVTENGDNLSQGQRQLLALARALLRNSKIIIMDEATASIDFDTDLLVQQTIRKEFEHSTIICIAHRLRTVIDYDRILVLDSGRLIEFDTPSALIKKSDSLFRYLCERSGEFENLLALAHKSAL